MQPLPQCYVHAMKDLDLVHCNTVQYTSEAWRRINTNVIGKRYRYYT